MCISVTRLVSSVLTLSHICVPDQPFMRYLVEIPESNFREILKGKSITRSGWHIAARSLETLASEK